MEFRDSFHGTDCVWHKNKARGIFAYDCNCGAHRKAREEKEAAINSKSDVVVWASDRDGNMFKPDTAYRKLMPDDAYVLLADHEAALAQLSALQGRVEEAEKDARRYKWLRDHWDEPEVQKLHPWDEFSPDPDQLDEQIDAALKEQPK